MEKRYGERIRKVKNFMRSKMFFAVIVIVILIGLLIARLVYINNEKGDQYARAVLSQRLSYRNEVLKSSRGSITDRNGVVLAQSKKVYNVIFDCKVALSDEDRYHAPTVDALAEVFGYDKSELEGILKEHPESMYYVLEKHTNYDKKVAFEEKVKEYHADKKEVRGVWFEEEYVREYPAGSLASHVIGFTGSENTGTYGIEQYYNSELSGVDGKKYGYFDDELNAQEVRKEAEDGHNIVSTIDYNVQSAVEREVSDFIDNVGCNNIGVLVMNPNNGEILALASNKEFDLNSPRSLSDFYSDDELGSMTEEEKTAALYSIWKNFCVGSTYEPGSTFKTITVSSALEEGLVSRGSDFECQGFEEIGGWHISCNNPSGHGHLSLAESLMKSCNCALMNIAGRLGSNKFYGYEQLFGFGKRTGVDLVGEESGILIPQSRLNETELATSSFGTTFNVTMVQMAAAYCSIINGGRYYRPHVVKEIQTSEGATVKSFDDELLKMTVSEETSSFIRQALYMTVESGTATPAKVDGYLVAGKTGTAQKKPKEEKRYVVSFAGFAPADDPQVFIYIVIDEVHDENLKGSSSPATSMTSRIFSDILPYLSIYPAGDIEYHVNLDIIPPSDKTIYVEGEDGMKEIEYNEDEDESNPDSLPEDYEDEENTEDVANEDED